MSGPTDAVVDALAEQPIVGRWHDDAGTEAPPSFLVGQAVAVPLFASSIDLTIEANVATRVAKGRGRLHFTLSQAGRPLFDLVPRPTQLLVDGVAIPPERLRLVVPPDEATPLRMLDEALTAGEEHVLDIEYVPGDDTVQFANDGAQIGFFMTDLNQRGYLERHAPANLEFDQPKMNLEIRLSGGGSTSHRLFTNGKATADGPTAWRIDFPDYFTCSSTFIHVTNQALSVRTGTFSGMDREIPLTAYGQNVEELDVALERARHVMGELEQTYGAYAHDALLIYCTGEVSGGMEYAGAAMTSLAALGHEITHSWFARGVMPANGNAGWIDEAIARWRDLGYPRAGELMSRPPVQLAGFSPYRRHTPRKSYAMGSLLLSELDRMLAPDGLRPALAALYRARKRQLITTQSFENFLESQTGLALTQMFDRYVYGKDEGQDGEGHESPAPVVELSESTPPPRRFTRAELRSLM